MLYGEIGFIEGYRVNKESTEKEHQTMPEDERNTRRDFPKSSRLTVNLSDRLYQRLSDYAMKHGRDMSEIIRACLDDYLTERGV